MPHARLSRLVEELGMGGLSRQCLHGKGGNEFRCAPGQHNAHQRPLLFQQSHQLRAFVGCDAAGDGHENVTLV